jgi:hypothetical protein
VGRDRQEARRDGVTPLASFLCLGAAAILIAVPAASDPSGPWVEAHAGWGFAAGDRVGGDPMSTTYAGMAVLGAAVGWHFGSRFVLSARVQYGRLPVHATICPVMDCSAYDVTVGADAMYRFTGSSLVVPWAAFGVGYEIEHITLERNGVTAGRTDRGIQLLALSGGADFLVDETTGLGPFAAWPLGRFTVATVSNPDGTVTRAIEKPGMHMWPMLGARVVHAF